MAMKRKAWIVLTACLAAILLAAACLLGWAGRNGIGISEGYYIETLHGHMVLLNGSPVSVSGKDHLFDGLTTGDRVKLVHGLVAESYPGQTRGYFCTKQEDGSEADIPAQFRASLKTLGWLALPLNPDEAEALAHLYTGFAYPIAIVEEDPQTGDWTVHLRSEDGQQQETVYIGADGQKVTVASGILYR